MNQAELILLFTMLIMSVAGLGATITLANMGKRKKLIGRKVTTKYWIVKYWKNREGKL